MLVSFYQKRTEFWMPKSTNSIFFLKLWWTVALISLDLVNHEGVLADKFGRPHQTDSIHLGSFGIKEFVKSIKSTTIIKKTFNQTSNDISSNNRKLNPVLHRPWQAHPSPWMPNHQAPPPKLCPTHLCPTHPTCLSLLSQDPLLRGRPLDCAAANRLGHISILPNPTPG